MILETTGQSPSVDIGLEGDLVTLTHPATVNLLGPDSVWDADDIILIGEQIQGLIVSGDIIVRAFDGGPSLAADDILTESSSPGGASAANAEAISRLSPVAASGEYGDLTGTPVFGRDYQLVTSIGLSSTTANTFQTKISMTTPALTGVYRVAWQGLIGQSGTNDSVEAQLWNATDSVIVGERQRLEPKDRDNVEFAGGVEEVVFAGDPKTFEIQWREQDGGTARIRNARIEIWRVR